MRVCRIIALLMGLQSFGHAGAPWSAGSYPVVEDGEASKRTEELYVDVRTADCEIDFAGDKVDLGIGRLEKGVRVPQFFSLDELEFYFARRVRSGFVVLRFVGDHQPTKATATKLKGYFAKLGYRRILFLRGHAFGTIVIEDYRAPQK